MRARRRRWFWRAVAAVLNALLDVCDSLGRWEAQRRWERRFEPQNRERVGL